MIAETAASIGDPQVRNRGTLRRPGACRSVRRLPRVMVALGADIQVKGLNGSRI